MVPIHGGAALAGKPVQARKRNAKLQMIDE